MNASGSDEEGADEQRPQQKLAENIRDGGLIAGGCLTIKTTTEMPPPIMNDTYYDDAGFMLGFALIIAGAVKLFRGDTRRSGGKKR
ncbi:MAG: hypothetical protein DCC64_15875 [Planctomycetota bacterium]|nr:MAG: hypothetical protein DCC64_15875 [Planctomycetota bacterium]